VKRVMLVDPVRLEEDPVVGFVMQGEVAGLTLEQAKSCKSGYGIVFQAFRNVVPRFLFGNKAVDDPRKQVTAQFCKKFLSMM
jgi:hypothetical protein